MLVTEQSSRRVAAVCLTMLLLFVCSETAEQSADTVLIEKKARRLTLLHGNSVLHTYRIALGGRPDGAKKCKGDNRTPEGRYIVDSRNSSSQYHRSLHISYPNIQDRAAAKKLNCDPGGDIFIHGLPNSYGWIGKAHIARDWTLGCLL